MHILCICLCIYYITTLNFTLRRKTEEFLSKLLLDIFIYGFYMGCSLPSGRYPGM